MSEGERDRSKGDWDGVGNERGLTRLMLLLAGLETLGTSTASTLNGRRLRR